MPVGLNHLFERGFVCLERFFRGSLPGVVGADGVLEIGSVASGVVQFKCAQDCIADGFGIRWIGVLHRVPEVFPSGALTPDDERATHHARFKIDESRGVVPAWADMHGRGLIDAAELFR